MIFFSMLCLGAPLVPETSDLSWRTITTERAQVHFHLGDRSSERTAEQVASRVDETILRLANDLQFWPRSKVQIVVVGTEDQVDGRAYFSAGLVLISTMGSRFQARMRGDVDWVDDVLTHELAHWIVGRRSSPWTTGMGAGFGLEVHVDGELVSVGGDLELGTGATDWFDEGVAEAFSERVGVNHWGSNREMFLRGSFLSHRELSWAELQTTAGKGRFGDGERLYNEGYSFLRWLAAHEGDEVLPAVVNELGRRPRINYTKAFKKVTGVSLRDHYAQWRGQTRARFVAEVAERQAQGVVMGARLFGPTPSTLTLKERDQLASMTGKARESFLAQHLKRASWPLIHPVYGSVFTAGSTVITGGERLRDWGDEFYLSRNNSAAAITDDGTLVFVSTASSINKGPYRGLLAAVPFAQEEDDEVKPVAIEGTDGALFVAAHQNSLLWVRELDGQQQLLWGPREGPFETLTQLPFGASMGRPSVCLDGETAVISLFVYGQRNLYNVHLQTRRWLQLSDDSVSQQDPFCGEDGVYFSADVDGYFDLFRLDPTGAVVRQTRVLFGAFTPFVDDKKLYYSGYGGNGLEIWVLDKTGVVGTTEEQWGTPQPVHLEATAPLGLASSPYRAHHSLRNPFFVPFLVTELSSDGFDPSAGVYLTLSDARGVHQATVVGVLGENPLLSVGYRHFARPLHWGVTGEIAHDLRTQPHVEPTLRRATHLQVEVGVLDSKRAVRPVVLVGRTSLAVAGERQFSDASGAVEVTFGPAPSRAFSEHVNLSLGAQVHRTTTPQPLFDRDLLVLQTPWTRVQLDFQSRTALSLGELELNLSAGATSQNVVRELEFFAGVSGPGLTQPTFLGQRMALGGLRSMGRSGEQMATFGLAVVAPLARDLHTGSTLFFLEDVELAFGGDLGQSAAFRTYDGLDPLLWDLRADLRLRSHAFDGAFDGLVRLSYSPSAESAGPLGALTPAKSTDEWWVSLAFGL